MSVRAYSYVMTVTRLIPSQIAQSLLAHLANHADKFGRHAFPSVPTLAADVHCSDRTVQRHLRWLERHGFIRKSRDLSRVGRIPEHKRPTVYELSLDERTRAVFAAEYRGHEASARPAAAAWTPVEGGPGDTVGAGPVTRAASKPSHEPTPLSPNGDRPPHPQQPQADADRRDATAAFMRAFGLVLAKQGITPDHPRRGDHRAAARLIGRHGVEETLDLASWVAADGFWCGRMLNVRSLERRWEQFRLARRHEHAKLRPPGRQDRGGTAPPNKSGDDGVVRVSSTTVRRCPVYGFRTFPADAADRTGEAQRHLDGLIAADRCPVCAHDGRNLPLHGGNRANVPVPARERGAS